MTAFVQDYRKLVAWQKARALTLSVYGATRGFPLDERFGLSSQLRRAAVSIQANLAEGAGRRTSLDFAHFLDIALGSANEVECLTTLSGDLGYIDARTARSVGKEVSEVRRMLTSLAQSVRSRSAD